MANHAGSRTIFGQSYTSRETSFAIEVFQSRDIGGQTEAEESERSGKVTRNEFDYLNMDIIKLYSDFSNF